MCSQRLVGIEVRCVLVAHSRWSSSYGELLHNESGNSQLLTNGEHLCFGNKDQIDQLLNTRYYSQKFPLIPQEHLYASSVIHPDDRTMCWLLHSRRVGVLSGSRSTLLDSAELPASASSSSAEQPALQHPCAGVGDINAVAHICYDCATCLCVDDKFIKMPRFALANAMWLGRQHPLLQNASLGTRLLLGLGRPCFHKLLLGKGRREDRESGATGNHVLVSQGAPSISDVLPPESRHLSDSFVAVYGQNKDDLAKCQILNVSRSSYKTLVEERVRVNTVFCRTTIDQSAVANLPANGVPQQLMECGVQMQEVDRYQATRCGPGTLRDPLDAGADDDDASDECSDCAGGEEDTHSTSGPARSGDEHPTPQQSEMQLNQCETPLGLDLTSTPDFVQHVASFKAHLDLVQDAVKKKRSLDRDTDIGSAEQPAQGDASSVRHATEKAAADEELSRTVLDLKEAASKLDKHQFQEKAKLLENVDNKAMFVEARAFPRHILYHLRARTFQSEIREVVVCLWCV